MSEENNTISGYLGPDFQQGVLWQLVTEPEFAEKIIPHLGVEYFDDPKAKRFFIVLVEYFKDNEKTANLQNKSIQLAIKKYTNHSDPLDEEYLNGILDKIILWNERIINKDMMNNGDVIQKEAYYFIKQQEYRKLGEFILDSVKTGNIKSNVSINNIEEKIRKIAMIGDDEDEGVTILENLEDALKKERIDRTPTGIFAIDDVTGGGIGRGEVAIVLSPSGVGKTTTLTKIANTAFDEGKNVLQIIFEDTKEQVTRKHSAIWSHVPLSEIDEKNDLVDSKVREYLSQKTNGGELRIKKFSDENTTIMDIRRWIDRHQKKYNMKFDMIVLDYLDCLESHKKSVDQNQSELHIIKSFISMASDYDIPCWSALQTNRTGIDMEWVESNMMGGNIKRLQKSHFVMSIAKTAEQKEGGELANIKILKARFAKDGHMFKDCIFNNNTLEIRITDPRWNIKDKPSTESSLESLDKKTLAAMLNNTYDSDNINLEDTEKLMRELESKNPISPPIIKPEVLLEIEDTVSTFDSEKYHGVDVVEEIDKLMRDESTPSYGIDPVEEINKLMEEETRKTSNIDTILNNHTETIEFLKTEEIPKVETVEPVIIIPPEIVQNTESKEPETIIKPTNVEKKLTKKEKILILQKNNFLFDDSDSDDLIDMMFDNLDDSLKKK
jgi:replicative DNA helicase